MRLTKRDLPILLVVLSIAPVVFLFRLWKGQVERNQEAAVAEPFRIAGNLYYVGTNATSAFLITGPEGHVLLDGDRGAAAKIIASIEALGFDVKDIKVLINSDPHDAAASLAELQQASGAQLWASDASARVIAAGGDDPDAGFPLNGLVKIGILSYPPARVDHRFKDGDTIHVGPTALTAHITAGASRGCTSWSFPVRDGDRILNVVSACPLDITMGVSYREQRSDLERSFRVLRSLPADIWLTNRARTWGRYRKFSESATAAHAVDPFIDPDGYRAYIDNAEAEFRKP